MFLSLWPREATAAGPGLPWPLLSRLGVRSPGHPYKPHVFYVPQVMQWDFFLPPFFFNPSCPSRRWDSWLHHSDSPTITLISPLKLLHPSSTLLHSILDLWPRMKFVRSRHRPFSSTLNHVITLLLRYRSNANVFTFTYSLSRERERERVSHRLISSELNPLTRTIIKSLILSAWQESLNHMFFLISHELKGCVTQGLESCRLKWLCHFNTKGFRLSSSERLRQSAAYSRYILLNMRLSRCS